MDYNIGDIVEFDGNKYLVIDGNGAFDDDILIGIYSQSEAKKVPKDHLKLLSNHDSINKNILDMELVLSYLRFIKNCHVVSLGMDNIGHYLSIDGNIYQKYEIPTNEIEISRYRFALYSFEEFLMGNDSDDTMVVYYTYFVDYYDNLIEHNIKSHMMVKNLYKFEQSMLIHLYPKNDKEFI